MTAAQTPDINTASAGAAIGMSVLREYAIAAFFAYFSEVRTSHIFPHKLAFSTAILMFFVSLLSISIVIRFRYLDHLVANNGTIDMSGPLWNVMGYLVSSNFVPNFRRIFGVYAIPIFLTKMLHKTDMPN